MQEKIDASTRGKTNLSWLESYHSFSFGHYFDPQRMKFGSLRVINDDVIAPGGGFGTHPHENMEIISYPVSGTMKHADSTGNTFTLSRGDVQLMRAGKGIYHSEFNGSESEPLHLYQIWIEPDELNLEADWWEKHFSDADKKNQFRAIVSQSGTDGSLKIHQDLMLTASMFDAGFEAEKSLEENRLYWLQVIKGEVAANGQLLKDGDALSLQKEKLLQIKAVKDSEFLLFDMGQ